MYYHDCCARTYGCGIQSMHMYLRDLDGRGYSVETRQPSESHLQAQRVWTWCSLFSPDFGSSAVGIIKQSVNSLGIRQFGPLAAQWAWTCTAKR